MTGSSPGRPRSKEAAHGWLRMFAGLVERGARSPTTLDEYRYVVARVGGRAETAMLVGVTLGRATIVRWILTLRDTRRASDRG